MSSRGTCLSCDGLGWIDRTVETVTREGLREALVRVDCRECDGTGRETNCWEKNDGMGPKRKQRREL